MIDLRILTPTGVIFSGPVASIHAASVEGEFTLLPNHMPVLYALTPCKVVVKTANGEEQVFAAAGGFIQMEDNKALLLSDAVEGRNQIDVKRAQEAYRRARARLEKKDTHANMKRTELALKKAINRLHVTDTPINN